MKILAFDTALFGCSAAVYDTDGDVCVCERRDMARGQAEHLVPMVQQVLAKAGAVFSDVDMIATTVGPGAFTGLRVGLSTAQGFGLALKKPVIGVTTLEVLAAQYFGANALPDNHLLGVLIETKRQDYYCQFFNADGSADTEPQALSGEAVRELQGARDVLYIGDALERFSDEATNKSANICAGYELPDPCLIAMLGFDSYQKGKPLPPEPLYLRDADISVSKKIQRVILES